MIYRDKSELIWKLVRKTDVVLDVGFSGQGVRAGNQNWPHAILKNAAKEVYGVDIDLAPEFASDSHYQKASAESFEFPLKFDVIFAGDIIEHLSNPGLFLAACKRHLKDGGRLIITTPNAFNLFNLSEKLTKREPTVNHDHTCYFNSKTLAVLLGKNGFVAESVDYLYTLGIAYEESFKKQVLNALYWLFARFTDKFVETLVVVAIAR